MLIGRAFIVCYQGLPIQAKQGDRSASCRRRGPADGDSLNAFDPMSLALRLILGSKRIKQIGSCLCCLASP